MLKTHMAEKRRKVKKDNVIQETYDEFKKDSFVLFGCAVSEDRSHFGKKQGRRKGSSRGGVEEGRREGGGVQGSPVSLMKHLGFFFTP